MESIIFGFLISAILVGLFLLFRVILPVKEARYQTRKSLDQLSGMYKATDFLYYLAWLLIMISLGYHCYQLLTVLVELRLGTFADYEIVVKPERELIMLGAGAIGMPLSMIIITQLAKWALKSDWEEYLAYKTLQYGFDFVRISQFLFVLLSLIALVLLFFIFNDYSAFGQKDIRISAPYQAWVETYTYGEVERIKEVERVVAPNGNTFGDLHYIIEFSDGMQWNSRLVGFSDPDLDRQIIDLVIRQTNLVLIKLEFDRASETP